MTDTNVCQPVQPGSFADRLTEVLRDGARTLLAQAVETEVASFVGSHADKRAADGHQRLVRHGHLRKRSHAFSAAIPSDPATESLCVAKGNRQNEIANFRSSAPKTFISNQRANQKSTRAQPLATQMAEPAIVLKIASPLATDQARYRTSGESTRSQKR